MHIKCRQPECIADVILLDLQKTGIGIEGYIAQYYFEHQIAEKSQNGNAEILYYLHILATGYCHEHIEI